MTTVKELEKRVKELEELVGYEPYDIHEHYPSHRERTAPSVFQYVRVIMNHLGIVIDEIRPTRRSWEARKK